MNILSFVDADLLPWILVLNVAGYWLKQLRLPKWFPPIPLILFAVSFCLCSFFGWANTTAVGVKGFVIAVLEYGIGNSILMTFAATFLYDVTHGFTKAYKKRKECNADGSEQ